MSDLPRRFGAGRTARLERDALIAAEQRAAAAEARVATLINALARYGKHEELCPASPIRCTCGLRAALAPAGREGE